MEEKIKERREKGKEEQKKSKDKVILVHTMKAYGGEEV